MSIVYRSPVLYYPDSFTCSDLIVPYDCELCIFNTQQKIQLLSHVCNSRKQSEVVFKKCKRCNYGSFSILEQLAHRKKCDRLRHASNLKTLSLKENVAFQLVKWLECEQCSYKHEDPKALRKHILIRHVVKDNKFKCSKCDYATHKDLLLKTHLQNRHYIQEFGEWYNCDHCKFRTKYKRTYLRHNIAQHTNEYKTFKCNMCSFITKTNGNLKRHKEYLHTTDDKIQWFYCDQCSHKTKTPRNLQVHKSLKHIILPKNLCCNECSFKTNTNDNLKQHIKRRHPSKILSQWFDCEQCNFSTRYVKSLESHLQIRHCAIIKNVQCEKCDFKTHLQRNLVRHLRMKHGRGLVTKLYSCKKCSYSTKIRNNLKYHVTSVHSTGPKLFKCDQCSFKSVRMVRLTIHKMTKHKLNETVQWYHCSHCKYKTQSKGCYNRHITKIHFF